MIIIATKGFNIFDKIFNINRNDVINIKKL